jgi:peptidoglycan/LPS O-acetylase OafA/YrhL/Tfp pilus assembly protein PilF
VTATGAASSELPYRPALDGFRGVAILLVVLYHVRLAPGGSLGVDMFFVLSGLLITSILLKEWERTGSIHLGRFYLRRFLRLGPALIAFVASTYVVTHFVRPSLASVLLDRWALAALFYVTNLVIAFGREYPLGAVSIHWSLALEEQFYLLWPLCFRFLLRRGVPRRRIAWWLLGGSALLAVWRAVLVRRGSGDPSLWLRVYFAPDTRADPLLLGCALALLLVEPRPRLPAWAAPAGAAAGVLTLAVLAATVQPITFYPYLFSITALASAAVLYAAWNRSLWARVLELPPLVWVGRLSYSLYLWHSAALAMGPAGLILLPAASHYLVERPFLKLKGRFSAGGAQSPASRWPGAVRLAALPAAGLLVLTLLVFRLYEPQARQLEGSPLFQARARVAATPNDPERLAELAETLMQKGELAEALVVFDRALALKPDAPRLLSASGLALHRAGRRAEAASRLAQALRLDPREPRALFGLGELALDEDRVEDAIAAYSRSLEIDKNNAATHNGLGIAYAMRGDNEHAIEHFSAAARISPEPSFLANLRRAQASRGPVKNPGP